MASLNAFPPDFVVNIDRIAIKDYSPTQSPATGLPAVLDRAKTVSVKV